MYFSPPNLMPDAARVSTWVIEEMRLASSAWAIWKGQKYQSVIMTKVLAKSLKTNMGVTTIIAIQQANRSASEEFKLYLRSTHQWLKTNWLLRVHRLRHASIRRAEGCSDIRPKTSRTRELTVALVMRKRVSCETLSTSGELFMMVFTLANGRFEPPAAGDDIFG